MQQEGRRSTVQHKLCRRDLCTSQHLLRRTTSYVVCTLPARVYCALFCLWTARSTNWRRPILIRRMVASWPWTRHLIWARCTWLWRRTKTSPSTGICRTSLRRLLAQCLSMASRMSLHATTSSASRQVAYRNWTSPCFRSECSIQLNS